MIRGLLRLLSTADYITPIINTAEEVVKGTGYTIIIRNERDLEKAQYLLEKAGISTWCVERFSPLVSNRAGLRVDPKDSAEARRVLNRAGISIRDFGGWS